MSAVRFQEGKAVSGRSQRWTTVALRVAISAGLVAWVIWRVSPQDLIRVAPLLPWQQLVSATAALVAGLWFADSFCVRWLFAQPDRSLRFSSALFARGSSYLLCSVNYELGQAAMAWSLSRAQGRTLISALGTCVLLAFHDIAVLLTLGLLGALLSAEPNATAIAFCAVALMLLAFVGMAVQLLPSRWQERWLPERLRVRLDWWTWRHSVRLGLLRAGYFSLILLYAATGLSICGIGLSFQVVCSVIPLVLLADGLPISISGLGTREWTLVTLINPEGRERAVLVAFSLLWTIGLVFGRALIGLAFWWLFPNRMSMRSGHRQEEAS